MRYTNYGLRDAKEVYDLVFKCQDDTHYFYPIEEGCLLDWQIAILEPYDNNHYAFVIEERYLNEWSSAYNVKRYSTLPKKYLKMIEEYLNRTDEA